MAARPSIDGGCPTGWRRIQSLDKERGALGRSARGLKRGVGRGMTRALIGFALGAGVVTVTEGRSCPDGLRVSSLVPSRANGSRTMTMRYSRRLPGRLGGLTERREPRLYPDVG